MSSSEQAFRQDEKEQIPLNNSRHQPRFQEQPDYDYDEDYSNPYDSTGYFASIFPNMYKRAAKNAPFSSVGRVVMPWYRNTYQNRMEVVNCTPITEQEINHAIFDLEDQTNYWSPNCYCLKITFWLSILLAIVGIVVLVIIKLSILLKILFIILIILVLIIILICLCKSYKNYLISREYAFKKRVHKNNQRIFHPLGTEVRVGPFASWLELLYNPENRPDFVRDMTVVSAMQPRGSVERRSRVARSYMA